MGSDLQYVLALYVIAGFLGLLFCAAGLICFAAAGWVLLRRRGAASRLHSVKD